MNIANEYMGPVHDFSRWLDMGLLAQGPLVTQMERIFWEDWCFTTQDECPPATPYPSAVTSSEHVAQLVSSGPNNPFDPIYEWLLTALYQAKELIWITTPYFIPDESLAKALELASKRGVEVRLLLPARSNHLLADLGRTSYLEQVQDAGVKLYFHPQMIHAKLTLIDDKYGLISSANMDSRSLLINYELGVCMFSPDEIKQLKEWTELHFRQCRVGLTDSSLLGEWVGAFARLIGPLI
jgi:cardiolipin synthase